MRSGRDSASQDKLTPLESHPPTRRDFEHRLSQTFFEAAKRGRPYVDVEAADLHRVVGGYPAPKGGHRMPICCGVMWAAKRTEDEVLFSPPKRVGATLRIRYKLPRTAKPNVVLQRAAEPNLVADNATGLRPRPRSTRKPATVALVSCVGRKRRVPCIAQDLYVSTLFKGMRAFAEATADQWFILSAEYGLLHPDTIVAPYERTLKTMSVSERIVWGERVRGQLQATIGAGAEVILLAGDRYRQPIEAFLRERGHSVVVPMQGLGIGQQLRWLKVANGGHRSG